MPKVCLLVLALVVAAGTFACSSTDSGGSSSSGGTSSGGTTSSSSGGTTSSSSSSGGTGTCTGDIASCPLGSLSAAQNADMCNTLAAAEEDPPGTKLTCEATGSYITVNSKETCIAQPAKSTCKVTLTYLLNCFKEAKKDACTALGDNGACADLFDSASGCI